MSTSYYLQALPEQDLKHVLSKKVRESLIKAHSLSEVAKLLEQETGY